MIESTPKQIKLPYENIFLKTADGKKINGWYLDNPKSDKVILHFHGNTGNMSTYLNRISSYYKIPSDVFVIDYHGFGKSEGKISDQTLYMDVQAAYSFLIKKKYKPNQIMVIGVSMGGIAAAELAATQKIAGVIIIATLSSAKDVFEQHVPFFLQPFIWINSTYNVTETIKKISVPILFIHAKDDKLLPYKMALKNYQNAKEPKYLITADGGHYDMRLSTEQKAKYVEFIKTGKILSH